MSEPSDIIIDSSAALDPAISRSKASSAPASGVSAKNDDNGNNINPVVNAASTEDSKPDGQTTEVPRLLFISLLSLLPSHPIRPFHFLPQTTTNYLHLMPMLYIN